MRCSRMAADRAREEKGVGDGQVHALGSGGRHDVGCVAQEEEPAVLHRIGDEAAHAGDALLQDAAALGRPTVGAAEPQVQLVPYLIVGRVVDVLMDGALKV